MIARREREYALYCPNCNFFTKMKFKYELKFSQKGKYDISPFGNDDTFQIGCPNCYNKMVVLDGSIGEYVYKFNELGYKTSFSCEGHDFPEALYNSEGKPYQYKSITYPYIAFSKRISKSKMKILKNIIDEILPKHKSIEMDTDFSRSSNASFSLMCKENQLSKARSNLYNFLDELYEKLKKNDDA